jgi:hypothetical protein
MQNTFQTSKDIHENYIYYTKLPNDKSKPRLIKINRKVKNINRKEKEVSNLKYRGSQETEVNQVASEWYSLFYRGGGGEYALRYFKRYKQLSRQIVKMSLVDKELKFQN